MPDCPVCGGSSFSILVAAKQLAEECRIREQFVRERLARPASHDELKDLTDFFHQEEADILVCDTCSLLIRSEHETPPAEDYSQDEYNPQVMERLYPQYVDAFRRKENPYRSLLKPGARVLEIGSHYGAFLQTAKEWGWCAEGVDIGYDTSRFAQSKGFTVHTCDLADCRFSGGTFDGVFIWNCFEQIEDPKPILREARRILEPNGLLTIRTPTGLFYETCEKLLNDGDLRAGAAEFLVDAMGYNNLLGFPYLYGHSAATLERLIEPFGFRRGGMLNSELLTLPLPENPHWVEEEERLISSEIRMLARSVLANSNGTLAGPWSKYGFTRRPQPIYPETWQLRPSAGETSAKGQRILLAGVFWAGRWPLSWHFISRLLHRSFCCGG